MHSKCLIKGWKVKNTFREHREQDRKKSLVQLALMMKGLG